MRYVRRVPWAARARREECRLRACTLRGVPLPPREGVCRRLARTAPLAGGAPCGRVAMYTQRQRTHVLAASSK